MAWKVPALWEITWYPDVCSAEIKQQLSHKPHVRGVSSCAAKHTQQQKTRMTQGPFFSFLKVPYFFSFQYYTLLVLAGWILHEGRRFKRNRLLYEAFGGMLAKRRERPFPTRGINRRQTERPLPREATKPRKAGHKGDFKIKNRWLFYYYYF